MSEAIITEEIEKRWEPVINEESLPEIRDRHTKKVVTRVLENTAREMLKEASGTMTADVATYDPVLIKMTRRVLPSLIPNEVMGVQPMSGPTGLIFAMKAWQGGDPATATTELFGQTAPDPAFAAKVPTGTGEILGSDKVVNTTVANAAQPVTELNPWAEVSFSIEKTNVTAETRKLKGKYTEEVAQDMRVVHGLDADTELSNIISAELIGEINREMIGILRTQAEAGAQNATTPGTFDLATDTSGRWEIEQIKGLLLQINREANLIAQRTRRGPGNFIITSYNVAGALDMAGRVDTSMVTGDLNVDGIGVTFAGILNGRFRLYVDPYLTADQVLVGYKGPNPYDAGVYFCPYTGLQKYTTRGEDDMQPRIGFATRYGVAYNPFVSGLAGQNVYYRNFTVTGL